MQSSARFQYSDDMEEDWTDSRYEHYPMKDAPMKKLINDEISRKPYSRKDGPSIVARLMGMDMLPLETKSTVSPINRREEPTWSHSCNNEKYTRSSVIHRHSNTYSFEHEFDHIYDHPSSKPKRRQHPQEEELQKFKKEFEAWQTAMCQECCRYGKTEKASTWALEEKYVGPKSHLVQVKSAERRPLPSYGENQKLYDSNQKEFSSFPSRVKYGYNETVPNKIVVLKPGPERIWSSEDSRTSFSGSSEERGSIEDFLEEVKERLKQEIHGKSFHKGLVVPRNGIASIEVDKSQDAQKIAKQISNRIRGSVTRDLEQGPDLVRSVSTRLHKSDIQLSEISSPEFISSDTRRFLAERLKNVLKREMGASDFSRPCLLEEKGVFQKLHRTEQEQLHAGSFLDESLSPKNLVRSLSAPVSGTSFGKLLLEDPRVITGAHIQRKQEHSIENLSAGMKKGKKENERLSLREKVYNFRNTFGLRRRLFRRRMASMADLHTWEPSLGKDIWSGPTVILDRGEEYENSTEVPPSPASVCSASSSQEEFCRPSYDHSPSSSPEETSGENMTVTSLCGDITSTCNEVQRQQSQSERAVEDTREHVSKLPELEDGIATYVRDLLVASGMYYGQPNPYALRSSDLQAMPISASVYEEVEVAQRQHDKEEEGGHHGSVKDGDSSRGMDRRILYDLVNEALPRVVGQPVISSRFRKNISVPWDLHHPQGPKLMDSVWGFISPIVYPPGDASLHYIETMLAREYAPWFHLLDEEADALGAEIEGSILRNLIDEIVRDASLTTRLQA
ncbi:hypothetical protein SAY86_031517 [Trapa natans]|uniref:DUF4378 domain-containing protein n=1 Tax=Trapa natans TaxID=22666 RepID=A0AAN7R3L3_TRANT|nr:hypothetical protein SAY86_031517 [Trapa natans]